MKLVGYEDYEDAVHKFINEHMKPSKRRKPSAKAAVMQEDFRMKVVSDKTKYNRKKENVRLRNDIKRYKEDQEYEQ